MLNRSNIPIHWSKDFVEHLRTIHFALIAVSAGLIILVASSKEYNAVAAQKQIEWIIELKHQWSPAWIEEFGEKETDVNSDFSGELDLFDDPNILESDQTVNWRDKGILGSIEWGSESNTTGIWTSTGKRTDVMLFTFPRRNWLQASTTSPDWSPEKFPRTLQEFEGWWERLSTPYEILIPRKIQDPSVVTKSLYRMPIGIVGVYGSDTPTESLGHSIQLHWANCLTCADPPNTYYGSLAQNKLWRLSIRVSTFGKYRVTQKLLAANVGYVKSDSKMTFSEVFPDLKQASEQLATLELEDIKDFIHDEAAKGPEVFEAFGMKFPQGQVTFWGITVLLCVQFYLLTYLLQLKHKLSIDDPGWDVPWMGMNLSGIAQLAFFASLVLLPSFAVISLAVRRFMLVTSPNRSTGNWVEKVELGLLFISCACGLFLALLSWRNRPRVAAGSTSAQQELFK